MVESREQNPPDNRPGEAPAPEGGEGRLQDILKKSRRRGLVAKGQQGLVEFDLPEKNRRDNPPQND